MSGEMSVVLVIGVYVFIAGAAIVFASWLRRAKKKRTKDLSALANSLGFQFSPTGAFAAQTQLP
jgi:hypothetical protein